jgi:hypothetical protein
MSIPTYPRTTESNDPGIYVFPRRHPWCKYKVTAELAGMQKFEGRSLPVAPPDGRRGDPVFAGRLLWRPQVGRPGRDEAWFAWTATPRWGHALERTRIQQLPIKRTRFIRRSWPTVPAFDSIRNHSSPTGMRTNHQHDAVSTARRPVNEIWEGWDFSPPPGLDAVEEVQVELQHNSSAKFTRPATVIMSEPQRHQRVSTAGRLRNQPQ